MTRGGLGVGVALLASTLLTGCATSAFMKQVRRTPIHVDPDKATVVFVRPSSVASDTLVTILDEDAHVLGDSLPRSYFVTRVAPGKHVFVGWAANTAALGAELEAGKAYYVEVVVRLGSLSSRANLFAVHATRKDTANLRQWFSDSRPYEVDAKRARGAFLKHEHEAHERVRRAHEILFRFTREEKMQRTLRGEDGRTE